MLKDLKDDLKSFWDENPFEANCIVYGACGGNRSSTDVVHEATIYRLRKLRVEGRISDIHLAVDYKYLKSNLWKMNFSLVVYLLLRNISWILVLAQLAEIIIWSLRDIADEDYPVYVCVKELYKKDRDKLFSTEHICICDKEKVECSLNTLEKQGIIEKVGPYWKRSR